MAIVVEDGSIVSGANSYVSVADLTAYATARGITLIEDEEVLLIKAMDYIESLNYQGVKKTQAQPLSWPRAYVFIDSYYFPTDQIPSQLKNGQMQTAIAIDQGNDPLAVVDPQVKTETVDVISVTYMDGTNSVPIVKAINATLYKLLVGGGSGGNVSKVVKG